MSYGEIGSKSRSQQNFKMSMNVCPDELLWIANLLPPNLVWWCIIMSQIVFQKDWFAVFKVNVTVKDPLIKIWLSYISSGLLIILRLNLVWWHIIISWIVLWTHWITVKVTENVENSSECSSGRYLFNCWTFCNQTWYSDASSWARVSCKKISLLSSSSWSHQGLI